MLDIVKEMLFEAAEKADEIRGFQKDFRWLSNFYPVDPFEYDGILYSSVETFYVAMKTLDKSEREFISKLEPNKAKRYGSTYHNKKFVLREDWDVIKLDVMEFGLRRKFSQEKFKNLLLLTRDIYIEETNNWGDVFWGCLPSGEGSNHLGKIIMKIRQELQEGKNILEFKPERTQVIKKKVSPTIAVNKRLEKFDVYAGRGSRLGNPFSIYTGEYTLEESFHLYAYEFSKKLLSDSEFRSYVHSLTGKKIGCFCKKTRSDTDEFAFDTTVCHAEIIETYLNSFNEVE